MTPAKLSPAEIRQRRLESRRRCYWRKFGQDIPRQTRGRRPRIDTTPRCPVCGFEISAVKDCRCP